MPQSLKEKKIAYCVELVRQAERALLLLRNVSEMATAYVANGYGPSGGSPLTQEDLDGSTIMHLSPQIVQSVVGAFNDMASLAPAQYVNLRKASTKPLGGNAAGAV